MASRLIVSSLIVCFACFLSSVAAAGGLDERGEAQAKEASQLYKQGKYEEAAAIFARLSVEYTNMPIFERNLGACFYYLRRPEPALSNLRRYLSRKQNIAPDDKAVVERWIEEMEFLRAQTAAAELVPSVSPDSPREAVSPAVAEPAAPPEAKIQLAQSPPISETTKPLGADLSKQVATDEQGPVRKPFYETWWFWSGTAALVAAGTLTTIFLVTRDGDACDGSDHLCVGVK